MSRLKGYTVMELIVVMVLSAIVVSIAYTSFDIISKQYLRYKKSHEEISKILMFDLVLTKDFKNSVFVSLDDDGIVCNYSDRKINYQIDEHFVVRQENDVLDTFKVRVTDFQSDFSGIRVTDPGQLINHFEFVQQYDDADYLYAYQKEYAADFLINHETLISQ
jgi:prepilin-type N-terminal cleavage/methylation domain-containing protein